MSQTIILPEIFYCKDSGSIYIEKIDGTLPLPSPCLELQLIWDKLLSFLFCSLLPLREAIICEIMKTGSAVLRISRIKLI